jgi:hypothetical protein
MHTAEIGKVGRSERISYSASSFSPNLILTFVVASLCCLPLHFHDKQVQQLDSVVSYGLREKKRRQLPQIKVNPPGAHPPSLRLPLVLR